VASSVDTDGAGPEDSDRHSNDENDEDTDRDDVDNDDDDEFVDAGDEVEDIVGQAPWVTERRHSGDGEVQLFTYLLKWSIYCSLCI